MIKQPWTTDDPLVTVTVDDDGAMTVQLFGVAYPMPPDLQPATRSMFGRVMDYMFARIGEPFTVEVIDSDGTRHTGTINLPTEVKAPRRLLAEPDAEGQTDQQNDGVSPVSGVDGVGSDAPAATPPATPTTPIARDESPDEAAAPAGGDAVMPAISSSGWFVPGERVSVCVPVGVAVARLDGAAPVEVPGWLGTGVLLVGHTSGVIRPASGGECQ
jgi:hypothetical protein